jgi:acyl-CoA thioester hydrolase
VSHHPATDQFVVETEFFVRYVESDGMRVVNHANYISWFEEARSAYARELGAGYDEMERNGFYMAVIEVNAQYHRPARYGDRVRVRCWVEESRSRTVQFRYEVLNAQTKELLTTGTTKHICVNSEGRVTSIPERWQVMLAGRQGELVNIPA